MVSLASSGLWPISKASPRVLSVGSTNGRAFIQTPPYSQAIYRTHLAYPGGALRDARSLLFQGRSRRSEGRSRDDSRCGCDETNLLKQQPSATQLGPPRTLVRTRRLRG